MATCDCGCHPRSEPDWAAPDARDHVAAVFACARCVHRHCPAILAEWEPPPDPPPPPVGTADGYSYDPTNDTD